MSDKNRRTERSHYGICLNDECSKCKNKEIQQIPLRKELVCTECGKPLRECAPATKKNMGKYIALVIILIVVGFVGFVFLNGEDEKDVLQQTVNITATSISQSDTILAKQDTAAEEETVALENVVQDKVVSNPSYKLEFGIYEGPMNNEKPHGYGGTIQVTRSYSIDLKKMPAEYLQVNEGDVIVSTKFKDGVLRAGELHRKDGTRKVFTI